MGHRDPRLGSRGAAAGDACSSLTLRHPDAAVHRAAERRARRASSGDQTAIDGLFVEPRHEQGGRALLDALRPLVRPSAPHPARVRGPSPQRHASPCAATAEARTPMHLVAVGGRDPEARTALEDAGLSRAAGARPAPRVGAMSRASRTSARRWRRRRPHPGRATPGDGPRRWRDARRAAHCPFIPAQSVRRGMVMFTEDGGYDVVESVAETRRSTARSTTSTSSTPTTSSPTAS